MKRNLLLPVLLMPVVWQLNAQNVGIGISNPTRAKLDVQGVIGNTVAIFGGDATGISIQRSNPAIGFNQYLDGTNSRYINNGYAAVQWLNGGTGEMNFDLFGSGTANAISSSGFRAITVSKNGNVGIGTAPLPYARVAVARGTGDYGTAVFLGTAWASHINYSTAENTYIRGGKNGSYVFLNDVPGGEVIMGHPIATATSLVKVGINRFNPSMALEVKQFNNVGLILVASNYSNWHFKVGPNLSIGSYQLLYYNESGNAIGAYHPQTGAYLALSDERVKTDITPMPEIGNRLAQLKPVQYLVDAPQADKTQQSGFIAQDLAQVFPSLVMHQSTEMPGETIPDMHLVNYDDVAVYAIKMIQEQQQKIETLKKRLATLKQAK